jgi:hypothetical protein
MNGPAHFPRSRVWCANWWQATHCSAWWSLHLRRGLSPEQIAFTLGSMDLSHETIYTALYAMPRGQLRARILTLLPKCWNDSCSATGMVI